MQDSRHYSVRLASKVGRISHRQALTWAKNGVLVPSRGYVTDHRPYILLYSFADLVALRVIAILRENCGLSLEAARVASDYIREHPDTPWNELPIWLTDKQVRFDAPRRICDAARS
jgi:DNA-binding transcriptional MerR regulator